MDGLRDGAAEGESAFACGGVAGDEEEEVGVEDEFVVFPADAGKAGRYDSQGTKEEQVGVFGGFLTDDDLLEEIGEWIRQGVREGRSPVSSVPSIPSAGIAEGMVWVLPSDIVPDGTAGLEVLEETETLMPWSLASWKKVLMVMPWPWAFRQAVYCLSHSS